eukprot:CAMPEP_0115335492 /NCGR_PEP_ID=MMETSP0270-20121206/88489_1 /TAXON_ID=71861 /ORGANISM="Scrippsiella trochoidea, Strain CCMP3099" /LENGTH=76 /DNA_ID=CAMNT_0002756577 /DNA_START=127 /DNA_END=357 /DNA_ORIENTATION=+
MEQKFQAYLWVLLPSVLQQAVELRKRPDLRHCLEEEIDIAAPARGMQRAPRLAEATTNTSEENHADIAAFATVLVA